MRSRKKDGGNSGGEYKTTKLTLADRVNNAFDGDNERKTRQRIWYAKECPYRVELLNILAIYGGEIG